MIAGSGTQQVAQMVVRGDFIKQGDTMLSELGVRIRDIRQGPDGYLYVLTEGRLRGPKDTDGMLLRLEPPSPAAADAAADARSLPEAEGRRQIEKSCANCHGIDMILARPRSADEWIEVVNTMIGRGLSLDDVEYRSIVRYLSENLTGANSEPR